MHVCVFVPTTRHARCGPHGDVPWLYIMIMCRSKTNPQLYSRSGILAIQIKLLFLFVIEQAVHAKYTADPRDQHCRPKSPRKLGHVF